MKLTKRIVSIVLVCLMLIGTLAALPFSVSAAGTTKTVEEAMAWVQSMLGQSLNPDGAEGYQCVDLIVAYYDFLGVPRSNGDGKDYAINKLPDGFTRIQGAIPQRGDILVYSGTGTGIYKHGHVAIFESTYAHYHQNYASNPTVQRVTGVAYNSFSVTPYWGVIRPNFASSQWYDTLSLANLGTDFYASILKADTGVYLHASNHNVQLADPNNLNDLSHIWHFVRKDDGSYLIVNCEDSSALTVANKGTSAGTNIETLMNLDYDSQRWFIYLNGDNQYVFKPKHCNLAMDVSNNSSTPGNNIFAYTYNGSAAQLFKIETQPYATTPKLIVNAGDYKTKTEFIFESDETTLNYNLYIFTGTSDNVTKYDTKYNIKDNSYLMSLPVGYYEAYAEACNEYSKAKGSKVCFYVTAEPVVGEDGWIYSEKLYEEITSDLYDIQYRHTYDKLASTSPGEDWVKGDLATTIYETTGETYWSNIELPTSETRVLVNYIYYHYCNASKGSEVNYEQTTTYSHYDWLPKTNVTEYSVANDYADSRYKFYHLKFSDGSDAYCSSGVSCDGTHGTHGARSYYWYKSCGYQDRVAVNYYHYTKDSGWQNTEDKSASVVTYRYKLKNNTSIPTTTAPDTEPWTEPSENPSTTPTVETGTYPHTSPSVNTVATTPDTLPQSKPVDAPISPSDELVADAEIADQETGYVYFNWSPVDGASYYDFTLYDYDGKEVFTHEISDTTYVFAPEDTVFGYFSVASKDIEENILSESALYSFILMDNEIQLAGNYGDVDENFKINIKDATAIQKYLANITELSDFAARLADANADNKVNIKDATTIQKYCANLKPKSRIGEMLTDSYIQQEVFIEKVIDSNDPTEATDGTTGDDIVPPIISEPVTTEPTEPTQTETATSAIVIPDISTEATVPDENLLAINYGTGFTTANVGDTITYSLMLEADEELDAVQAVINFDSTKLKISNEHSDMCSNLVTADSAPVINATNNGKVFFNASTSSIFDFTDKKPLITIEFEVIGTGETEISHEIEVLHMSYTNDFYFNYGEPVVTEGISLAPVIESEDALSIIAGNQTFTANAGDTITYYVELQADELFEDIQGSVFYDSTKLKLIPQSTAQYCPLLSKQIEDMYDLGTSDFLENEFTFAAVEVVDGFDFTEKRTLVMLEFEVLETGTTSIDCEIDNMTIFGGESYYFYSGIAGVTDGITLTTSLE